MLEQDLVLENVQSFDDISVGLFENSNLFNPGEMKTDEIMEFYDVSLDVTCDNGCINLLLL